MAPQPFDYTLRGVDPVAALQSGMAFGQQQRAGEQDMALADQRMAIAQDENARREVAFGQANTLFDQGQVDRTAALEAQKAMNADLAALAERVASGDVSANDFAAIATKYPDMATELGGMWEGMEKGRKDADVAELFKGVTAIKAGRPDLAIQMLEDRATAAENSGDQMEADIARATAAAIKADPAAGLTSLGLLLQVVDPDAAKTVFGDAPEMTADQKNYNFYAKQEQDAGRTPMSFNEWGQQNAKAGASVTNINTGSEVGTIPQGYELFSDPATGARSMRPIPGGPEDKSSATANAAGADIVATDTITTAAARAREAAQNRQLGGFGSNLAAKNPYTDSAEVERQLDVLRANAATTTLQAMRDASPTGSTGLGALTAPEMKVIQDKAGALDQKSPTFLRDLDDYERTLLRTIHGPEAGDRIFNETRAAGDPGSPPPAGADDLDALLREAEGLSP